MLTTTTSSTKNRQEERLKTPETDPKAMF